MGNLLVGIGTLLGSITSAVVFVVTWRRTSRRERETGASTVMDRFARAAADGRIDPHELEEIAQVMRDERRAPPSGDAGGDGVML